MFFVVFKKESSVSAVVVVGDLLDFIAPIIVTGMGYCQ